MRKRLFSLLGKGETKIKHTSSDSIVLHPPAEASSDMVISSRDAANRMSLSCLLTPDFAGRGRKSRVRVIYQYPYGATRDMVLRCRGQTATGELMVYPYVLRRSQWLSAAGCWLSVVAQVRAVSIYSTRQIDLNPMS